MSSAVNNARFEHHAFVWEPAFKARQSQIYRNEDNVAVEETPTFDTSIPLTTRIVIERFLEYRCDRDRDIYLYRNRRIESFLKGLDLEYLRRGSTSHVNNPIVLLDDRSDIGDPTATPLTDSRPLREPLTAHQFYLELSKTVCCIHSLSNFFIFKSPSCSRN
jgi:hypothetical protein